MKDKAGKQARLPLWALLKQKPFQQNLAVGF